MKIVAVSGRFDPIHIGHIKHFEEAKKLGDKLVVILNSDEFSIGRKGYVFMPFQERKEILESIKYIDEVIPCIDSIINNYQPVSKTLEKLKPDIFAKGGDRDVNNIPESEREVCKRLGIKVISGVGGGKIQSSSWLVNKFLKNERNIKRNQERA